MNSSVTSVHCPRNKAHEAHDYTVTVPSPIFGSLDTREHCPGHGTDDARHLAFLAYRREVAAEKELRRSRRARQIAEQHAESASHWCRTDDGKAHQIAYGIVSAARVCPAC